MCNMAHHYAGGSPNEAVDNVELPNDKDGDHIRVPGSDTSYELNFNLDLEELVHEGKLVQADVAAGLSIFLKRSTAW